eukprot:Em0245g1a
MGPQLVRLASGPTPAEGRMELYYNGSYGTICQIGWDLVDATVVSGQYYTTTPVIQCAEDAKVICRQWASSGTSVAFSNAYFGAGSSNQPIWLDDVNCLGPQLVRLASGPTPTEGRAELYYNGSPYDQKG